MPLSRIDRAFGVLLTLTAVGAPGSGPNVTVGLGLDAALSPNWLLALTV
jgi:hypothetical protein